MANKEQTSLRLSPGAKRLLEALATKLGVTQTAIIEMAIREFAVRFDVEPTSEKDTSMLIGISLGQFNDRTALSIVERSSDAQSVYSCRHLQVWEPGTTLENILYDALKIIVSLPQKPTIMLDVTVAGASAGKMLREGFGRSATTEFCAITAGLQVVNSDGLWQVPRNDFAATLRILMETERLRLAAGMPLAVELHQDLMNFRVTSVTDSGEIEWRAHKNDDLVFALAIACWRGE